MLAYFYRISGNIIIVVGKEHIGLRAKFKIVKLITNSTNGCSDMVVMPSATEAADKP